MTKGCLTVVLFTCFLPALVAQDVLPGAMSPPPAVAQFGPQGAPIQSPAQHQDVDEAIEFLEQYQSSLPAGGLKDLMAACTQDLRCKQFTLIGTQNARNNRARVLPDLVRADGTFVFRRKPRCGNWILLDENDWSQGGDYEPDGEAPDCDEVGKLMLAVTLFHEALRSITIEVDTANPNWMCEMSKINVYIYSTSQTLLQLLIQDWPLNCPPSQHDMELLQREIARRSGLLSRWLGRVARFC